jgi:hypothetical protein
MNGGKDQVTVNDPWLATLYSYSGYPLTHCVSTREQTEWTFSKLPLLDFECLQEEYNREDFAMHMRPWIGALKCIQHAQARAKRDCLGIWSGTQYRMEDK